MKLLESPSRSDERVRLAPDAIDLIPDSWGPKFKSGAADATLTRTQPSEIALVTGSFLFIVLLTAQPGRVTSVASSKSQCFDASPGTIEMVPAGCDFRASWKVAKENILVMAGPERMRQLCEREFNGDLPQIRPPGPGQVDPVAHQIAGLLRDEFRGQYVNELYLESLSIALIAHLVRRNGLDEVGSLDSSVRGGLSPYLKRRVEEYMRAHLGRAIALSELADLAGLSYGHFLRAFRQAVGVPPHRYLMRLRAEEAQRHMLLADLPLKRIAEVCGFANQSHMTTVMRRLLKTTPNEIRRLSRAGALPDI